MTEDREKLTSDDLFNKIIKHMSSKDLNEDTKRILYENLWDLYDDVEK